MSHSTIPRRGVLVAVLSNVLALVWSCAGDPDADEAAATAAHLAWQEERLAELRAEDGWLAVVGLAWLEDGAQTVGWGPSAGQPDATVPDITLPEPPDDAPAVLATIRVETTETGPRAWIVTPGCADCRLENGSGETRTAEDGTWSIFSSPNEENPIVLHSRGFEMFTMDRGGRLALRVRNRNSPRREMLVSIPTHDYARGWIVEGRFEPADGVRELAIDNSTDRDYPQRSVGRFRFQRDEQEFAMELIGSDPGEPQLLMVGDASNGERTYGGGRYVYVDVEDDGVIRVDFNRLYNPPCVFTPWATCPLPPPSNRLPFRVPVGEQNPVFSPGAK